MRPVRVRVPPGALVLKRHVQTPLAESGRSPLTCAQRNTRQGLWILDVRCLLAFGPLSDFEDHLLTFLQGLETIHLNS